MGALLRVTESEIVIFNVPALVTSFPDDMRHDWAWWQMIRATLIQENVLLLGSPREIEYVFADKPDDVDQVVMRHPCGDCTRALEDAKTMLRTKEADHLAIVQFNQDYLQRPGEILRRQTYRGA